MKKKKDETISIRIKKVFFTFAGSLFLTLGFIGIIIPILPTTPFLLLSAACYYKGSERLHKWMLNNRWFGSYIRNYKEGRGIPYKTKVFLITLLWITISYSTIFVVKLLLFQIVLIVIAIAVSIHVFRLPSIRKKEV